MTEGWKPIGEIGLSGRLSLSDSSYFYDNPTIVAVPAGIYCVSVNVQFMDEHPYVARIRVALVGSSGNIAESLGEVVVDFAQIGICDRDRVEMVFETIGDSRMPEYFDQLNMSDLWKPVAIEGHAIMWVVRPGFGDGLYPVHALRSSAGEMIGVELDATSTSEP